MWKDYSFSYIKNNRASSISIVAAAFVSTLFLSLLCTLFFNLWRYDIDGVILREGSWQGRITGDIEENDYTTIQNFPNVEKIEINKELSDGRETAVDVYFSDIRAIYWDMPLIAERLGLEEDAAAYHTLLLSKYLIHDPKDDTPPLLLTFYLVILIVVSASMILIIHNSFAVSMTARIHQFGIFSSVGATPGQIRICLIQEALALCVIPVLAGTLIGIALSFGIVQGINIAAENVMGRHEAVFAYHPIVFLVTVCSSFLTVLFSAYIPARRLSKISPLEAIRNTGCLQLKRKRRSHILSRIFGIEGELAGNALRVQKKALRTSTWSLTLSFLAFTVMLCFFTLSGISTRHTYFERYQDVWDVMLTVKDTAIGEFALTEEIQEITGVESGVVYQKAMAVSRIADDRQSDELSKLGGLETVAGASVSRRNNTYLVPTPIVVLDDNSFAKYCRQVGIRPQYDGTITLNRIWDGLNSNFRYKRYIPYVKEEQSAITIQNREQAHKAVEIPVLAYTQEVPALREEYDHYALVQFIPLSMWKKLEGTIGNAEKDVYIRVLAKDGITLDEANGLETSVMEAVSRRYAVESENRLQEKVTNDHMLAGYMLLTGAFCILLAGIGIANVFSYTLGFLHQRKREFAQYMSIGMTPADIRKMLFAEALVIAGRPLFITLPLTILFVGFMIRASFLNPMEFLKEMPFLSILIFISAIFGFVALAYYLGGKKGLENNLAETLRNDTLT